ncbi:hypothetical protein SCA6_000971 [Theobroma cacao]
MSTQFLINDEKLKYVLATIAVTVSREQQFPKGKHSLKMFVQIAVPSLKGESVLLCVSGASINDKIATECLKHVKSGTSGGCMICETMLTMFGILSSTRHISFRLLVKHFLQYHLKKGFRIISRMVSIILNDWYIVLCLKIYMITNFGFNWKLQRLVPGVGANKLVWKDAEMGMLLLIQVGIPLVAAILNACYNPAH